MFKFSYVMYNFFLQTAGIIVFLMSPIGVMPQFEVSTNLPDLDPDFYVQVTWCCFLKLCLDFGSSRF